MTTIVHTTSCSHFKWSNGTILSSWTPMLEGHLTYQNKPLLERKICHKLPFEVTSKRLELVTNMALLPLINPYIIEVHLLYIVKNQNSSFLKDTLTNDFHHIVIWLIHTYMFDKPQTLNPILLQGSCCIIYYAELMHYRLLMQFLALSFNYWLIPLALTIDDSSSQANQKSLWKCDHILIG